MVQFIVIFSLSVAGSLVGFFADLAFRFAARKARSGVLTVAPSTTRALARHGSASPPTDPVIVFGSILACYGAMALALVGAIPAPLAMERTVLTFAFLCVGGLIGEISKSGSMPPEVDPDVVEGQPVARKPPSRGLSLTLALALNLACAVLSAGQELIDSVPAALAAPAPEAGDAARAQELQPIFVVAERPGSARRERMGSGYPL